MADSSPRSGRGALRRLSATKSPRAALVAVAEARGWLVVGSLSDLGYSEDDLDRIGVALAGDTLNDREHALVVARVDEASRHVVEIASVMDLATRERWALLAIDVRPATVQGEDDTRRNQVLATLGPCERRLIAERTREVLAQRREEGVRLGRPPSVPGPIRDRVRSERAAGRSLRAIAEGLNQEAVATAQGGRRWYASTVSKVLASESESPEPSTRPVRGKLRSRDDRATPLRRSQGSRR